MNGPLYKFPSTPHLAWLGTAPLRNDKVLAPGEVAEFLSGPVIIEEKIDGANLGLSFGGDGSIRFQHRGDWLRGALSGPWSRLREWAAAHELALREHLSGHAVLFGEWCLARHSVPYRRLPDWFLAFDVLDTHSNHFWTVARRKRLAHACALISVPEVARGVFRLDQLVDMLRAPSAFGDSDREGLYIRREVNGRLVGRAKLVRPEFCQTITRHWARAAMIRNATETSGRAASTVCLEPLADRGQRAKGRALLATADKYAEKKDR